MMHFYFHILSVIFRNCINLRRELSFKLLFTCAYLVLHLLIMFHIAVYRRKLW
jgi:hypothetical protein